MFPRVHDFQALAGYLAMRSDVPRGLFTPLETVLPLWRPFTQGEIRGALEQVLVGIGVARRAGVVHGAIGARNIVLGVEDALPTVLRLGVAQLGNDEAGVVSAEDDSRRFRRLNERLG